MCYIIVDKDGNKPANKRELKAKASANPDGGGVAWYEEKAWHWIKGLTSLEAVELYLSLDVPKALHLRFATAGARLRELAHPFPTKQGNELYGGLAKGSLIMHNGTIPGLGGGSESDTLILSRMWDDMGEAERAKVPWRVVELTRAGKIVYYGHWYKTAHGMASSDVHRRSSRIRYSDYMEYMDTGWGGYYASKGYKK